MNAVAKRTASAGLAERLQTWVSGARAPQVADTALARLRAEAERLLRIYPFPLRRFEGWRTFPLRALARLDVHRANASEDPRSDQSEGEGLAPNLRLRGDRWAQLRPLPDGVQAGTLVAALAEADEVVLPRREETFAAAGALLLEEGLDLRVDPEATPGAPVVLVHDAGPEAEALFPRTRVVVGAGAKLTVVEVFRGGERALVAPATEVRLGEGATLTHLRLLLEEVGSVHLGTLDAVLDARAHYHSQVFSLGCTAARLDLQVELRSSGSEARLEGVALGSGTQHLEQHTRVIHAAPASESHATYRAILADRSVSTFDGTIAVRREAAGTVATLENRNLLLSDEAVVHTQPRLEIDTDEVQCSHGATVGQLDPAQLFYLRSRGLGLEEARGLLTLAFVRALADRVDDPALHALVLGALAERMPGVDATRLEGVA